MRVSSVKVCWTRPYPARFSPRRPPTRSWRPPRPPITARASCISSRTTRATSSTSRPLPSWPTWRTSRFPRSLSTMMWPLRIPSTRRVAVASPAPSSWRRLRAPRQSAATPSRKSRGSQPRSTIRPAPWAWPWVPARCPTPESPPSTWARMRLSWVSASTASPDTAAALWRPLMLSSPSSTSACAKTSG